MVNIHETLLSVSQITKSSSSLIGLAAYIDPNTGGMLFQVLVVLFGVITGLLLFLSGRFKSIFYKVRRLIRRSDAVSTPDAKPEEPLPHKE